MLHQVQMQTHADWHRSSLEISPSVSRQLFMAVGYPKVGCGLWGFGSEQADDGTWAKARYLQLDTALRSCRGQMAADSSRSLQAAKAVQEAIGADPLADQLRKRPGWVLIGAPIVAAVALVIFAADVGVDDDDEVPSGRCVIEPPATGQCNVDAP